MATMTTSRRVVFVALLFSAMGAATLAAPSMGILATFIIDDLSISRTMLGWIIAANVILAAVLSPATGWVTDRIGGKVSLVTVFGLSAAAFAVFGMAAALPVLFIAAAIAAIGQSGANPATNKLIGEGLPPGERGVTTGIKQSGVQAAITAAGLVLPTLAIAFGWRAAMFALSIVPLVGAVIAFIFIPASDRSSASTSARTRRLPASTWWLAGYGLFIGFSGAVTFFIPLFAAESLGLDPRAGGLAVALVAAVAFMARILWARYAEQQQRYLWSLGAIAMLSIIASVLLLASTRWIGLLWLGAAIIGASSSAWNSVAMLTVINEAGAATGRASGVVLAGFLTGLGVGPPLYGATVDATGSYDAMWIISIITSAAAVALVWLWRTYRDAPTAATTG